MRKHPWGLVYNTSGIKAIEAVFDVSVAHSVAFADLDLLGANLRFGTTIPERMSIENSVADPDMFWLIEALTFSINPGTTGWAPEDAARTAGSVAIHHRMSLGGETRVITAAGNFSGWQGVDGATYPSRPSSRGTGIRPGGPIPLRCWDDEFKLVIDSANTLGHTQDWRVSIQAYGKAIPRAAAEGFRVDASLYECGSNQPRTLGQMLGANK